MIDRADPVVNVMPSITRRTRRRRRDPVATVRWGSDQAGTRTEHVLTDPNEVRATLVGAASQAGAYGAPYLITVVVDPEGAELHLVIGATRAMARYLSRDGDDCFVAVVPDTPAVSPAPCDDGGRLMLLNAEDIGLTPQLALQAATEFVHTRGCLPTCIPKWVSSDPHMTECVFTPDSDERTAALEVFATTLLQHHRPQLIEPGERVRRCSCGLAVMMCHTAAVALEAGVFLAFTQPPPTIRVSKSVAKVSLPAPDHSGELWTTTG